MSLQVLFSIIKAINSTTRAETQLEWTTVRNQAPNRSSFDLSCTASNRGKPPVTSQQPVAISGSDPSTSVALATTNTTRKDTTQNPNSNAQAEGDKCYRCGQLGHRSNQFPQRGAVNLVEGEEFVERDEDDVDSEDKDDRLTKPNDGDLLSHSLVVRRFLLTPRREGHSLRHSIFKQDAL